MAVLAEPVLSVGSEQGVPLLAKEARAASGVGSLVVVRPRFRWITFQLLVFAATGAGSFLEVRVQQSLDGANFDDVAGFQRVDGDTEPQIQSASLPVGKVEGAGELHAWNDGTLPVGTVATTVLGRRFRARWTVGGSGTFTFAVVGYPRDL